MVSALNSRASGPGSRPGQGHCVVTLTVPLSAQVYKLVPANLILRVTLRWTSIPSKESRNTRSRFMSQNRDKLRPDGPLGSYADFALPVNKKPFAV